MKIISRMAVPEEQFITVRLFQSFIQAEPYFLAGAVFIFMIQTEVSWQLYKQYIFPLKKLSLSKF